MLVRRVGDEGCSHSEAGRDGRKNDDRFEGGVDERRVRRLRAGTPLFPFFFTSRTVLTSPLLQYGVLNVNTTEPTGNFWEAIGRDDCQRPVDYMELIRQVQADDIVDPAIEFMRNRTIVIYGDSVDRDHNQHFCELVGGRGEMIADTHELSPPYPEGREIPPEDCTSSLSFKNGVFLELTFFWFLAPACRRRLLQDGQGVAKLRSAAPGHLPSR